MMSLVPESQQPMVSSIVRIQDSESWRVFSKEYQMLGLSSNTVKVDLFWSESSMKSLHETYERNRIEESLANHECFYFHKKVRSGKFSKTLVLCKLVFDPVEGQCVVDQPEQPSTLHMDARQCKDAVTPLFAVFFSASHNNFTPQTKNTESKTISLNVVRHIEKELN